MVITCLNSDCKYYWEDCCILSLEDKKINVNNNGECTTKKEGTSEYYIFEQLGKLENIKENNRKMLKLMKGYYEQAKEKFKENPNDIQVKSILFELHEILRNMEELEIENNI